MTTGHSDGRQAPQDGGAAARPTRRRAPRAVPPSRGMRPAGPA